MLVSVRGGGTRGAEAWGAVGTVVEAEIVRRRPARLSPGRDGSRRNSRVLGQTPAVPRWRVQPRHLRLARLPERQADRHVASGRVATCAPWRSEASPAGGARHAAPAGALRRPGVRHPRSWVLCITTSRHPQRLEQRAHGPGSRMRRDVLKLPGARVHEPVIAREGSREAAGATAAGPAPRVPGYGAVQFMTTRRRIAEAEARGASASDYLTQLRRPRTPSASGSNSLGCTTSRSVHWDGS